MWHELVNVALSTDITREGDSGLALGLGLNVDKHCKQASKQESKIGELNR